MFLKSAHLDQETTKEVKMFIDSKLTVNDLDLPDIDSWLLKKYLASKEELKKSNIRDHFNLEKPWIDHIMVSDDTFEKVIRDYNLKDLSI